MQAELLTNVCEEVESQERGWEKKGPARTLYLCFGPGPHRCIFPVAQMVKNLPVMQETWVQSLGREDPLERGMATHSSILAWEIPWTEEPGGLQFVGSQRVGHDRATNTATLPQV